MTVDSDVRSVSRGHWAGTSYAACITNFNSSVPGGHSDADVEAALSRAGLKPVQGGDLGWFMRIT